MPRLRRMTVRTSNGNHLPRNTGLREYQAAHLELRSLLNAWDPIGVASELEDEYDHLIPDLYERLCEGHREPELLAFLHERVEHFGLEPRPEADRWIAGELVSWFERRAA